MRAPPASSARSSMRMPAPGLPRMVSSTWVVRRPAIASTPRLGRAEHPLEADAGNDLDFRQGRRALLGGPARKPFRELGEDLVLGPRAHGDDEWKAEFPAI